MNVIQSPSLVRFIDGGVENSMDVFNDALSDPLSLVMFLAFYVDLAPLHGPHN